MVQGQAVVGEMNPEPCISISNPQTLDPEPSTPNPQQGDMVQGQAMVGEMPLAAAVLAHALTGAPLNHILNPKP